MKRLILAVLLGLLLGGAVAEKLGVVSPLTEPPPCKPGQICGG